VHRLRNPRAGRRGGPVRQGIGRKKTVRDNLVTRGRRRGLSKRPHHKQRHVIAIRYAGIEIEPVQCRAAGQLDVSLLEQLASQRIEQGLARLDTSARQVPAADVAVLDQENAACRIENERPYAQCQAARKAPVEMENASKHRFDCATRSGGHHSV